MIRLVKVIKLQIDEKPFVNSFVNCINFEQLQYTYDHEIFVHCAFFLFTLRSISKILNFIHFMDVHIYL